MEKGYKIKYFLEYVFLENEFRKWLEEKGYKPTYIETCIRFVRRVFKIFGKIPKVEDIELIKANYKNKKSIRNIKTAVRRYYDFLEEVFYFKP